MLPRAPEADALLHHEAALQAALPVVTMLAEDPTPHNQTPQKLWEKAHLLSSIPSWNLPHHNMSLLRKLPNNTGSNARAEQIMTEHCARLSLQFAQTLQIALAWAIFEPRYTDQQLLSVLTT